MMLLRVRVQLRTLRCGAKSVRKHSGCGVYNSMKEKIC